MPLLKADGKLIYYAHVPKCGGSSIAFYLEDRFGPLGLYERAFLSRPEAERWSRTSPQHIDAAALETIIPLSYIDAVFAVVRHPVARAVSTYHFQREVEGTIPHNQSFSDWLAEVEAAPRYAFDNHVASMDRLVPDGAEIFHLEHGLDPLVAWLDLVTGTTDGPRAILPENRRGAYAAVSSGKVQPTSKDLDRIAAIYAADFARFGYSLGSRQPLAPPRDVTPERAAEAQRAIRRMSTPVARLRRRLRRRLAKL